MKHTKRSKKGFTLVELIVVIAILAILAGIAIPVYSGYIEKANEAADLQLLSAVNTAFGAACAGHGLDPTEVNATAQLDAEGRLVSVTPTALNEDFLRYYGENVNVPFKVYTSLGYDRANGRFVNGATEVSVAYGDGIVTVTMEQITAYNASTFGDMGSSVVLDEVNHVVNAAKLSLSQLSNPNNPAYATYRAELEAFLQENYGISLAGLNDIQRANALVLMVASKAGDFDAASLVEEFNTTGMMNSLLPDLGSGSEHFLANSATAMTIPYAMALAYVNSDAAGDMFLTTKTNTVDRLILNADQVAGWTQEQLDAYAQQWAEENGYTGYQITASFSSNGKARIYAKDEVDYSVNVKDLFYNGYDFTPLGTVNINGTNYSNQLTGANDMANTEDVENITNLILNSDGFKAYMQSGQGEQDLNAFFTAMTMLENNAKNINTNDLLTNGFGDDNLQEMIALVLGN